uniref:Sp12 gene n=1 Tax=Chironomus tentans TaxID=7153 RepID=Q08767_CHITE|nr:unnamed protein product [Chironomus tentans]
MRFLLLFLIVTVLVAIAYTSPVPETAAVAALNPGAVKKGPGGALTGPGGRKIVRRAKLQAGRGKQQLRRGKLQAGKGGPLRKVLRKRKPAA